MNSSLAAVRIAYYVPGLRFGGAERAAIALLAEFSGAGADCTLIINSLDPPENTGSALGDLRAQVPSNVKILELGVTRSLHATLALGRALRELRPDCLISCLGHSNAAAVVGRWLARGEFPHIARQESVLSLETDLSKNWKNRFLPFLYRHVISRADAIVCVSSGVARDLGERAGVDASKLHVIYNPVITGDFGERLLEPSPARDDDIPTVIAVGRLSAGKDFPTFLRAVRLVNDQFPVRAKILGNGMLLDELKGLTLELELEGVVEFCGFLQNPLPTMRAASVFVSASKYEGFGNAIVEALGCGVPVVSTDCPTGPREILADGKFGRLVPVSDPTRLAQSIIETIVQGPVCTKDEQIARSTEFSSSSSSKKHAELISELVRLDR